MGLAASVGDRVARSPVRWGLLFMTGTRAVPALQAAHGPDAGLEYFNVKGRIRWGRAPLVVLAFVVWAKGLWP